MYYEQQRSIIEFHYGRIILKHWIYWSEFRLNIIVERQYVFNEFVGRVLVRVGAIVGLIFKRLFLCLITGTKTPPSASRTSSLIYSNRMISIV